jgi:hypothetical protein
MAGASLTLWRSRTPCLRNGRAAARPLSFARAANRCCDAAIVAALRGKGFEIAIETNGSIAPIPAAIDWVCVAERVNDFDTAGFGI